MHVISKRSHPDEGKKASISGPIILSGLETIHPERHRRVAHVGLLTTNLEELQSVRFTREHPMSMVSTRVISHRQAPCASARPKRGRINMMHGDGSRSRIASHDSVPAHVVISDRNTWLNAGRITVYRRSQLNAKIFGWLPLTCRYIFRLQVNFEMTNPNGVSAQPESLIPTSPDPQSILG
jgi:hypothetical protein